MKKNFSKNWKNKLLTFYVSIIISTILREKKCNTVLAISSKRGVFSDFVMSDCNELQSFHIPHVCLLYNMWKYYLGRFATTECSGIELRFHGNAVT